MKQGMLHGVEKNVNQFSAINRQTQEFSNTWAEHAAKFKVLPGSSPQVDATNPVARPASKFLNAEEEEEEDSCLTALGFRVGA